MLHIHSYAPIMPVNVIGLKDPGMVCWKKKACNPLSYLMKISAILSPMPDPPPVINATWSLENKEKTLKGHFMRLLQWQATVSITCIYWHLCECMNAIRSHQAIMVKACARMLTSVSLDCRRVCTKSGSHLCRHLPATSLLFPDALPCWSIMHVK